MLWYKDIICDELDGSKSSNRNEEDFNIHVSVRLKPVSNDNFHKVSKVTLPLHQRLALIKHRHKLSSNRDALNILKEEGEWFQERWLAEEKENIIDNTNASSKIDSKIDDDVGQIERQAMLSCGIQSIDCLKNNVVIVDPTKGLRNFEFDRVLSDNCSQETVYGTSAEPLVQDFINSINACCLVYGVTGSGKTFTMFGPEGIVPRAFQEIFDILEYRKLKLNLKIDALVSVSYVEVFGSEISDLLRDGRSCCPNKAASQRFVLSGASEFRVNNVNEVVEALRRGDKQKRKAATALNDRSSRAHSIVIISLAQTCKETGVSRTSKLFLADLGGCEQTKKSCIESGISKHFQTMKSQLYGEDSDDVDMEDNKNDYSTGFVKSDRMREAIYINLGLMALKSCVEALVSKSKYIPYSESKLTMILSTALGGNSKTSVIICASQDKYLAKETIASLRFGQSCRLVSNSIQTETDFLRHLIDKIDAEILICEEQISKKERWIVREEKRKDVLAEDGTLESTGFGGVEIRKTTVLVGAEEEHIHLRDLIRQKSELVGVTEEYNDEIHHKFGGEIGFGNAHSYGLGKKFNHKQESEYRFGKPIKNKVPLAVKSTLGDSASWKLGEESLNEVEKSRLNRMKKKSSLVYSGISA